MTRLTSGLVAVALVLLPARATPAAAQTPVVMPGSETHQITSATNGIEYRIDVALPAGYATSAKRYPVFYILDGNLEFDHLVSTYRELALEPHFPELIVVGIGWPGDDPSIYTPSYQANRQRDYTPTSVDSVIPGTGGAAAFLGFVKAELLPMIDARYRTDPADRGLGGHSLGGLFTNYTLLKDPTIFRRYWIGSPSLWWDNEWIFGSLPAAKARAEQPKGRAFLTVGGLESDLMVAPMGRMAAALKASFPGLATGSIVYPDDTHLAVIGASMSRALRFLYGRPEVPIQPADAAAYSGTWTASSGETIEIAGRGGRVMMTMAIYGKRYTTELFAEARDRLFSKSMGVDVLVEREGTKVTRLRRDSRGDETVFDRVR